MSRFCFIANPQTVSDFNYAEQLNNMRSIYEKNIYTVSCCINSSNVRL